MGGIGLKEAFEGLENKGALERGPEGGSEMKELTIALMFVGLRPEEIRAVYLVAGGENPRRLGPEWRAARQKIRAVLGVDETPRTARRRRAN